MYVPRAQLRKSTLRPHYYLQNTWQLTYMYTLLFCTLTHWLIWSAQLSACTLWLFPPELGESCQPGLLPVRFVLPPENSTESLSQKAAQIAIRRRRRRRRILIKRCSLTRVKLTVLYKHLMTKTTLTYISNKHNLKYCTFCGLPLLPIKQ